MLMISSWTWNCVVWYKGTNGWNWVLQPWRWKQQISLKYWHLTNQAMWCHKLENLRNSDYHIAHLSGCLLICHSLPWKRKENLLFTNGSNKWHCYTCFSWYFCVIYWHNRRWLVECTAVLASNKQTAHYCKYAIHCVTSIWLAAVLLSWKWYIYTAAAAPPPNITTTTAAATTTTATIGTPSHPR